MKIRSVVTVCLVVWLSSLTSIWAAESFTPHRFIATALSDPTVTEFLAVTGSLAKTPGDTPYIDRMELRVGIDSSEDETGQNYRLRLYPRPWGETGVSRQLSDLTRKGYGIEQNRHVAEALRQRYTLVLKFVQCAQLLKLKRALSKIYVDRIFVLQKKLTARYGTDVGTLIASENKRIALQLEIKELENRMAGIIAAIQRMAGSRQSIVFKESDLITISMIQKVVAAIPAGTADRNGALERRKHKVDMADCRYALEKARSRDYIRFLEVGRSVDDGDDERVSFEIGLRLPFIGSYRKSIWERQADLQREKFRYDKMRASVIQDTDRMRAGIELLIAQYKIVKEGNKKGNALNAVRSHITSRGADPLELLKLNEGVLENDIRLCDLAFSVRASFIELLDHTGQLTGKPLINYLSNYLVEIL